MNTFSINTTAMRDFASQEDPDRAFGRRTAAQTLEHELDRLDAEMQSYAADLSYDYGEVLDRDGYDHGYDYDY